MAHDLKKYVEPFLATGDYWSFDRGNAGALEAAIVQFCQKTQNLEIIANSQSINAFSKMLIDKIEQAKFKKFLEELAQLVDEFNLDFVGSADAPDYRNLSIFLNFAKHDESQIDRFIRYLRNNLTTNYIHEKGRYPLAVWKSYIRSAKCWSVQVAFSDSWELREDIQG